MFAMIGRIFSFARDYRARIYAALVLSFLNSLLAAAPIGVAAVLIAGLLDGTLSVAGCGLAMGGLLVCLGAQAACQYGADRLQSSAGYELFASKRLELAEHLRRLPMGYFTAGNLGRISSVLSADMVFIEENCMKSLADLMSDIFSQIVLTVFLFVLDWRVGAVALCTEALVILIGRGMLGRRAAENSQARQEAIGEMNTQIIEHIEGLGAAHDLKLTSTRAAGLRESFSRMTDVNIRFEKDFTPWVRAIYATFAIGATAILGLVVYLYQTGAVELFAAVAVMLFAFSLFNPLRHLYAEGAGLTIMQAAMDRFEALMAEPELPAEGADTLPACAQTDDPELEFRDVCFSYGESGRGAEAAEQSEAKDLALSHVSFTVEAGQTVALVGPSGSGKTTAASLVARFWDVDSGAILMRGKDLRDLPLGTVTDQIAMVFQRVYLFQGTVYENILMGRSGATREEVVEAARKARALEFIERLPYGFETRIGEGGSALSGGEAQRISIARAILKNAPIVVLDEATASVDPDNEEAIQAAISELCAEKTLIVIAHRLNTVVGADKILVLDGGRLVETGTHEELMAKGEAGRYRRMFAAFGSAGASAQHDTETASPTKEVPA